MRWGGDRGKASSESGGSFIVQRLLIFNIVSIFYGSVAKVEVVGVS